MPPKSRTSNLRPHSRSSSATRLGANLQFTQAVQPSNRHSDKPKKVSHTHDLARVSSTQRIQSKEQLPAAQKRHLPQQQQQYPKPANTTRAKGFTIASPSENADGDDDEWVSSESGAATQSTKTRNPKQNPALTMTTPLTHPQSRPFSIPHKRPQALHRVETARPSDFDGPRPPAQNKAARPQTPPLPKPTPSHHQQPAPPPTKVTTTDPAHKDSSAEHTATRPKRYSRPPSMHSVTSKSEHHLRPHPLIRGHSLGPKDSSLSKPAPLAPLTVIPSAALPEISTSPPNSAHDGVKHYISSSPTSVRTTNSPVLTADAFPQDRRMSFSSARSIHTIPVHSTIIREPPSRAHERTRTLSTLSTNSSSAALSSLTHLPTVTRPPSPQPVSFFPPINPYANVESIHPLLPNPYLANHLTVLARRTPIRESFDRVVRAKQAR